MSEVKIITLEDRIDSELQKENVTEKVIAAYKEKYGHLKLKSLDDKESYLIIKEARKDVRNLGILTEKICKAGREDAVKEQKLWLGKEKEILSKIAEVQDPLDAEIKKFDDEEARIKKEEAERKEAVYINRQQELTKMGVVYMSGNFSLDDVSFEANLIKDADEEIWNNTILPKYVKVFEIKEAARIEEERKKKEEADRLQKEKDELEEQQRKFREEQEKFKREKEEEARKEANRIYQEKMEKDRADEKKWRGRLSMMQEVGWNGQFAFSRLGNDNVSVFTLEELISLDEFDFNKRLTDHNNLTQQLKEKKRIEQEEERKIEIKNAEEAAAKKERDRIEEEQRLEEVRKQQEEQRKREEMDQSSDKNKWEDIINRIDEINIHEMKSPKYRKMVSILKEKFEEIKQL